MRSAGACAVQPEPEPEPAKITVTDPWSYAELSQAVEAQGFRFMQHHGSFMDRAKIARH